MKRITTACIAAFLILTLSSCVVTEDLNINTKEGGSSSANIQVEDFFVSVLEDFSDLSTDLPDDTSVMDASINNFSSALKKGKTISNVNFTKIDDTHYLGNFDFNSINELITDLGKLDNQTILTLQGTTLSFDLDMDNYDQLVKVIPFLADPNFETFGPTYNQGMSENDYYDMISYMLGEEGPGKIASSIITINITTPSPITSFSGGEKIDSTTFRYQFPLIDFLLLNDSLNFTLTW